MEPIISGKDPLADEEAPKQEENGLDMVGTLAFYEDNQDRLHDNIPRSSEPISLRIREGSRNFIPLSDEQISGILNRFPEQARARSCATEIVGKPHKWFKKTDDGSQLPTANPDEAISLTAIIPSYVAYSKQAPLEASIELNGIFPQSCSRLVAEIVCAEGLAHEYAHTIIAPILYSLEYPLRLKNGDEIDGFDLVGKYADTVDTKPAISHYASFFRDPDNKFVAGDDLLKAISEELAEAVAAYVLGFAYTKDGDPMDPFAGKEDARQIIEDILLAEKVE